MKFASDGYIILFLILLSNQLSLKTWTINEAHGKVVLFYANAWGDFLFKEMYITLNGVKIFTNHDKDQDPFFAVKKTLEQAGCTVKQVFSVEKLDHFDFLICFDPLVSDIKNLQKYPREKLILFVWEPPTVKPSNYLKAVHAPFSKVFTLMDDLVDNVFYYKFYEPQPTFEYIGEKVSYNVRKLCTMLVGQKGSSHPNELYSERLALIHFFDSKHVDEFDFYGLGWNASQYRTYRGFAESKLGTYQKYRFCICYENAWGMNGYITSQKIIYPMLAGCIPVYRGAPNICSYIPSNCFIAGEQFKNHNELYNFLKNMPQPVWQSYQKAIKKFLKSKKAFLFSTQNMVNIFFKALFKTYEPSMIFDKETVNLLGEHL